MTYVFFSRAKYHPPRESPPSHGRFKVFVAGMTQTIWL